jgi:peptidoglycan hydrolase-like protein with peptidoglycan-binding domain
MAPPPLTPEQIKWVQTILKAAAGESGLKIDSRMGTQTREALKRFQRRFSLTVDGLVSRQTTTALTQLALNHIAKQSRLAVDGIAGPKTSAEVKMIQSRQGLESIDGKVGRKTMAAMVTVLSSEMSSESISVTNSGELYQVSEANTENWYAL